MKPHRYGTAEELDRSISKAVIKKEDVTAAEAAVILNVSLSCLAQRRSNHLPPPYWQLNPGRKGSPVKYPIKDLLAFKDSLMVVGTMEAISREYGKTLPKLDERLKGKQRKATPFDSLINNLPMALLDSAGKPVEHPFWVLANNPCIVIAHILDNVEQSASRFEQLDIYTVCIMSWREAFTKDWAEQTKKLECKTEVIEANGDQGESLKIELEIEMDAQIRRL